MDMEYIIENYGKLVASICRRMIQNRDIAVCMFCAMAKKMGAQSPCNIYCMDPMEGMIKGIAQGLTYDVLETLWSGSRCKVEVRRGK